MQDPWNQWMFKTLNLFLPQLFTWKFEMTRGQVYLTRRCCEDKLIIYLWIILANLVKNTCKLTFFPQKYFNGMLIIKPKHNQEKIILIDVVHERTGIHFASLKASEFWVKAAGIMEHTCTPSRQIFLLTKNNTSIPQILWFSLMPFSVTFKKLLNRAHINVQITTPTVLS